jgi:hypothetical protein
MMPRLLLGLVVVHATCAAGCSGVCGVLVKRHGLKHHLVGAAGQSAMSCGAFRHQSTDSPLTPEEMQAISSCATEAHREGRPFYFSEEGPGIDSYVARGLLGTRDGGLLSFHYDSAPCGSDCCDETFALTPCSRPPAGTMIGPHFECRSVTTSPPSPAGPPGT